MIVDDLNNYEKYLTLHPAFSTAFKFLKTTEHSKFINGKIEIDSENLFATASLSAGKGLEYAKLESHRKYIDIQYSVNGIDNIGWKPLDRCSLPESEYDPEKDIQFFLDAPDTWFCLIPGTFAIFFPDDAHAPLAVRDTLHKIIIKVHIL